MLRKITRKTFTIRESGRSTDFITPSFGFGCVYDCLYCYMKRHKANGIDISNNANDILTAINNHVTWLPEKVPNQTGDLWTYDISCNEDFAAHAKHHNWQYIFDYFVNNPRCSASLATKTVPKVFLNYNPLRKVRIRFSLMPQIISNVLEPNTALIIDRIKAIDTFISAGYDVHINFSPIVVFDNWLKYYAELFKLVNANVKNKHLVKCECIFLTHNESKHNKQINKHGESLLWTPGNQEPKISNYGGNNIRYKHTLKSQYIQQFTQLHNEYISWCDIRYIF